MNEYLFKYIKRTDLKKDEKVDPTKVYGNEEVVELVVAETAAEAYQVLVDANEDEIRLKDITKL